MDSPKSTNSEGANKQLDQHEKSNLELIIQNKYHKIRLQTFVDAAIAIIITILVLELDLSGVAHSNATILESLSEMWLAFANYFIAFFLIALLLYNHHRQFVIMEYANSRIWWINLCFIAFIALVPFTTSVYREYRDVALAVILFQLNILLASLVLYFNFLYVVKHPLLLKKDTTELTIKILHATNLLIPISAVIGIGLAFINPLLSNIAFGLIVLGWIFLPIVIRHKNARKA